jgi:SAM-dependent methyltransferase
MVVLGGVTRVSAPDREVLELGCGSGRLLELLQTVGFSRYVGVDISAEAVAAAQSLNVSGASFFLADFETWTPPQNFDVIVFTESLYYAKRPAKALQMYSEALKPAGGLVISMIHSSSATSIWRHVPPEFHMLERVTVKHHDLPRPWDVAVLTRKV